MVFAASLANHYGKSGGPDYSPSKQSEQAAKKRPDAVVKPAPKAPDPEPNPKRNEWRAERDLEAQRGMAESAKWTAYIAGISALITAIGVIYVALTLRATRAAVLAAERGSDAALAAVRVTSETAQRELRAYLVIESAVSALFAADKEPSAELVIRNFGKTPAFNVRFAQAVIDAPNHQEVLFDINDFSQQGGFTVGPNGAFPIPMKGQRPISAELRKSIFKREYRLYFIGEVLYQDAFGFDRYVNFRYLWLKEGGYAVLRTGHKGNDAN